MKPEPIAYGDRKVYPVAAFNAGVATWLERLPELWVEGEISELRRQAGWQSVFFTLRDPDREHVLPASMPRTAFDALDLSLADGARVHVLGRAELFVRRGEFRLRASAIEPVGEGAMLLRLEALRRRLAAEGLFAPERKRPLPELPRLIGVVTGSEAAAKLDVVTSIRERFPPARIIVVETALQGPRAPAALSAALHDVCAHGADVVIVTRGGGSFEDLLPFSDEALVRAIAACPVPVVSAVGHEQDTPLCDLAADVRASTPTAAARLVVPDARELAARLAALRSAVAGGVRRIVGRAAVELERDRARLVRAPALLLGRKRSSLESYSERLVRAPFALLDRRRVELAGLAGSLRALAPSATLARGYAIVRHEGAILREAASVTPGDRVEIELAAGDLRAQVDEVRG